MTVSESDGSVLTFNKALARFVIMFAPATSGPASSIGSILGLILSLAGLDDLPIYDDNDPKRRASDHYAHSVVIKPTARRLNPPEPRDRGRAPPGAAARSRPISSRVTTPRDWDGRSYSV